MVRYETHSHTDNDVTSSTRSRHSTMPSHVSSSVTSTLPKITSQNHPSLRQCAASAQVVTTSGQPGRCRLPKAGPRLDALTPIGDMKSRREVFGELDYGLVNDGTSDPYYMVNNGTLKGTQIPPTSTLSSAPSMSVLSGAIADGTPALTAEVSSASERPGLLERFRIKRPSAKRQY